MQFLIGLAVLVYEPRPCSPNMVTICDCSKLKTSWKSVVLQIYRIAWKFWGSFILWIGDFLWFVGTNFCGSRQSGSKWKTYLPTFLNDSSFAVQFNISVSKTRAILLFKIKVKLIKMFELNERMPGMRSAEYQVTIPLKFFIIMQMFRQSTNQNHYPVFG